MAMTLDQFITKYHSKQIDYDGFFGFQCMDLYRQYVKDVLGFPQSDPVPGAADVWTNYRADYFNRIENTPRAVPVRGDIIIWDRADGMPYGHIAVFYNGDLNSFMSFDQNWGGNFCHYQNHNYSFVLGWLRPNQPPIVADAIDILAQISAVIDSRGDTESKIERIRELVQ
jgi:hypothetical protein